MAEKRWTIWKAFAGSHGIPLSWDKNGSPIIGRSLTKEEQAEIIVLFKEAEHA